MAAYWEIAAHSAYDMFSKYEYLVVTLVFPISVFGLGISFVLYLFRNIAYLYLFKERGTNVYINNPGLITKMVAMPIYGKNPSKVVFSGTSGPISTKT